MSIDLYGVYAAPVYENGKWTLKLETTVRNDFYEDKEVSIETKLIDRSGNIVTTCGAHANILLRDKYTFVYECDVKEPVLWDLDNRVVLIILRQKQ